MKWTDRDEIGYQLQRAHHEIDPLTLRFTELHAMVTELADFDDDPAASNEGILEAIQMAWLEFFSEDQEE